MEQERLTLASAQPTCANGMRVEGIITDPTGAVIPGAQVQAAGAERTITDIMGHYVLPCVPASSTTITVQADGFARGAAPVRARRGGTARLNL
jgi:hypothetical protein